MYKIEIWKYGDLSEVYVADDIAEILLWYKWNWRDCYEYGLCSFSVYRNGIELEFDELNKLGFYGY